MAEPRHHDATTAAARFAAGTRVRGTDTQPPVPAAPARTLNAVRVDVVGLVREVAEQLQQLPSTTSPMDALAQVHNGFGALTLAAAVLDGQGSSTARTNEYAAISLAVVAAHEHIADVVDEQLLDDTIDARVLDLLDDAENLHRIRVSARWLRAAAIETAEATRAALAHLADRPELPAEFAEAVDLTGRTAADIRILLDGPADKRAALTAAILQRM